MRLPPAWTGLLLFAAALAALEGIAARRPPWIAARMLAIAAVGLIAFRLIPWIPVARSCLRRPALRPAVLYLLFMAHFLRILLGEALSLYLAWRLAAPRRWRASWWRALVHATASLFPRVLRRAERFYAALLVRGLAG